ncbi:hypothetical protein X798_04871 [Onchocerca flexuosa]|uniref:Uncharacterized protein n=1 Tax=Onchocerca flexuosa TaxID=387005 RepID=A0A238BTT1_9BILA|nr:hypothetical protein X798_04871 [Onchocerca flexuosa]
MGLCCSANERHHACQIDDSQNHLLRNNRQQRHGIEKGIAMMMQQATALAGASSNVDLLTLEAEIRKAKAEGRTVTISNGCVYFDYQLVGRIPPHTCFPA